MGGGGVGHSPSTTPSQKKRKPVRQFAEFRHAEWAMLPIRHRFNLPTSLLKKSDEAISCQRPIVTQ